MTQRPAILAARTATDKGLASPAPGHELRQIDDRPPLTPRTEGGQSVLVLEEGSEGVEGRHLRIVSRSQSPRKPP